MTQDFIDHLGECGILSEWTPPGIPQLNGVSEQRNRTLLDMVRSKMSQTDLPVSFWGHALETVAFILNQAPTKAVETTPYEVWSGKRPKLSFMKIWGCEAYVKCLMADNLEPRSDKCIFVGYPKETFGYYFYKPDENKVFVARNGVFLEKEFLSKIDSGRTVHLEEIRDDTSTENPEEIQDPHLDSAEEEPELGQEAHAMPDIVPEAPRRSERTRQASIRYRFMIIDGGC